MLSGCRDCNKHASVSLIHDCVWFFLGDAGVAGLSCAGKLHKAGKTFKIYEASNDIGGRVQTDKIDGFLLDRGFQIFLTSYPTAKQLLDYEALDLKPFYAGSPFSTSTMFPRKP